MRVLARSLRSPKSGKRLAHSVERAHLPSPPGLAIICYNDAKLSMRVTLS